MWGGGRAAAGADPSVHRCATDCPHGSAPYKHNHTTPPPATLRTCQRDAGDGDIGRVHHSHQARPAPGRQAALAAAGGGCLGRQAAAGKGGGRGARRPGSRWGAMQCGAEAMPVGGILLLCTCPAPALIGPGAGRVPPVAYRLARHLRRRQAAPGPLAAPRLLLRLAPPLLARCRALLPLPGRRRQLAGAAGRPDA